MTPSEEIRVPAELCAAAAKVRGAAASATDGPWTAGHVNNVGWAVSDRTLSVCIAAEDGWTSRADLAWIALANPVLAEPLAAWLEAEAHLAERDEMRSTTPMSLAVARVINRSAP